MSYTAYAHPSSSHHRQLLNDSESLVRRADDFARHTYRMTYNTPYFWITKKDESGADKRIHLIQALQWASHQLNMKITHHTRSLCAIKKYYTRTQNIFNIIEKRDRFLPQDNRTQHNYSRISSYLWDISWEFSHCPKPKPKPTPETPNEK